MILHRASAACIRKQIRREAYDEMMIWLDIIGEVKFLCLGVGLYYPNRMNNDVVTFNRIGSLTPISLS
jgi:hypothetical protein